MSRMDSARTILGSRVSAAVRDRFLERYAEKLNRIETWYSPPEGIEGFKFLLIIKRENRDISCAGFTFGYVTTEGVVGQKSWVLPADMSCEDAQHAPFIQDAVCAHLPNIHLFHGSSWARGCVDQEMDAVFSAALDDTPRLDEDGAYYPEYFLPNHVLARIVGTAKAGAKRKIGGALAAFRQHIPDEVLTVANKLTRLDLKTIIWLNAEGDPDKRRSRCQAASLFPLLFDILQTDLQVSDAIDGQRPLLPVLVDRTRISSSVLRRMRGKTWRFGTGSPNVLPLAPFIGLDPNDFPVNRQEMREHVEFSRMRGVLAGIEWGTGMLSAAVMPARPHDMRMIRDAGGASLVSDALREVSAHVLLPRYIRINGIDRDTCEGDYPHLIPIQVALYRSLGVRGSLKLSKIWHENLNRLNALKWSSHEEQQQPGWTPILGAGRTDNGLSYDEISSENDLFDLGKEQRHCVFSYLDNILYPYNGNVYGFVFRCHRDGKTLNTIYYQAQSGVNGTKVTLIEQRGMQNADPEYDAIVAAECIRKTLETRLNDEAGSFSNYAERISEYSEARHESLTDVSPHFLSALLLLLPKSLQADAALDQICKSAHEMSLSPLIVPENGRI